MYKGGKRTVEIPRIVMEHLDLDVDNVFNMYIFFIQTSFTKYVHLAPNNYDGQRWVLKNLLLFVRTYYIKNRTDDDILKIIDNEFQKYSNYINKTLSESGDNIEYGINKLNKYSFKDAILVGNIESSEVKTKQTFTTTDKDHLKNLQLVYLYYYHKFYNERNTILERYKISVEHNPVFKDDYNYTNLFYNASDSDDTLVLYGSDLPIIGGKSVRKSLDKCTVAELKERANKRGIKVSGLKKAEIIDKLRNKSKK